MQAGYLFLALLGSGAAQAQQDSVTVSANISKRQLELERDLNAMIAQAKKDRASGDFAAALRGLEKSLETVRGEPMLKEQEDRVLGEVGRAYLEVKRPEDALRTYTALLELRKDDCKPGGKAIGRCAEAQADVGLAQVYRGDFAAALPLLRDAEANYGKASEGASTEDYRMITSKQQADTQIMLAMSLLRTGQRSEALSILNGAVQQLDRVQRNEKVDRGIRESARDSLRQAEQILGSMKGN